MSIDFTERLDAIVRTVSFPDRDGKPVSAVALSRSFATTVEEVWDAVTNPNRIPRWFLPVSGDLRVGGRYQFEGNAGGEITACEQPAYVAATWEFGGDVSWVEAAVSSTDTGGARLTLTHTAHLSEFWDTYGPGASGVGWEMGFTGLALHLERPDEPLPDEEAFAASPEGKAYISGSSEAWAQASIDAGTPAEAANRAARRTTAFYTGEPEGDA